MRSLKLWWLFIRVSVMYEMQYRVNFFLSLFQSALALSTGLIVLGLVFGQVDELNGWNRAQLLAVLGVFTLLGGVIRMVIRPNMNQLMDDVREGTLDYVLTQPVDSQLLVSIRRIQIWQGVDIIVGAIVLGVAIAQLEHGVGVLGALAFAVALVLGASIIYCFLMLLTTTAFWFVRIDQIIDLFDGVYQAARWPVGIYPGWLRIGLTVVVPLGFAVTLPASALTPHLSGATLLAGTVQAVVLFAVTRWFWKFGVRHYSGASA